MAVSAIGRRDASSLGGPATAAVVSLAALAAVLHLFTPFNHDEAYFLALAGRLLDGGRFGTEIMDINPPHVWWISAVPVWFARQFGARLDIAATVFTAAMVALSLVAVDRLIALGGFRGLGRCALVSIAAILVLFAPGYDFGQREHWMLLLTLPYVVARSRRAEGAPLSPVFGVFIGVGACLGFCIKPYYLLIPLALEIWLLVRTRRPSLAICPETIALAVTGLVYAGLILVYAPSYLLTEVPNALLGYWSYKSTLREVLSAAIVPLAMATMLALLGTLARDRGARPPALAQAFAVAGAANLLAALLQMKPWPYHFLPSVVFLALAAGVLLATETNALRRVAITVLLAMAFTPGSSEMVSTFAGSGTPSQADRLAALFRANPGPNRTVFGFVTSPRDIFPAVLAARMDWAAPFCCEYLVAAAARADEAPAAQRAAIRAAGLNQAEMAVAAVRNTAPGVIVVATGDDMLGFPHRRFDYVKWLGEHTDFASILTRYRETVSIGSFRVFVRM